MHMADALISPVVGVAMDVVSVGAIGVSIAKVKKDVFSDKKIPLMGIAGALVFAGQMINFTIPATGSSGHIGGGILLAGLLGGVPAFLSIAAVLIIQCLFFADGGLLALGCNIFNMGVIPCLLIYPLIFKPLLIRKNKISVGSGLAATVKQEDTRDEQARPLQNIGVASIVSVMIGLEIGAFCVVLETLLSGITALPFGAFSALMLPIHLAIGLVEGLVTAAILIFVNNARPEIISSALDLNNNQAKTNKSITNVLIPLAIMAVIIGGGVSLFASSNPDGLEWAIENISGETELENNVEQIFENAANAQEQTALLPDYAFKSDPENNLGTSVSGIVGAIITFALAGLTGLVISRVKKRNYNKQKNVNA